ncbi:polyketide cyclase [Acinetobacter sp. AM]|uniref:nuclear transport factor 2 family protein n=1 Tax=Acinetobacter sp. AM TaxID=2170730 RepID=UPI000DE6B99B|nr:nuclear transport factor 2 family protein [Acinetobacter sp. AM]PWB15959.1 polyketide cyclase [Acinetobacter sp. AM]
MDDKVNLVKILSRLEQLEAHNAIRNCLNRYMEICDELSPKTNLDELMELFDAECIWEGIGEKYAKSFGRYDSWQAIYNMFKSYTQTESHFVMNAHFVSSEQIEVQQQYATATWLMLQTSTFRDGRSHLNSAKLKVKFAQQTDGSWKIKHFQTQNIFSRPVTNWQSDAELPVPTQN